MTRIVVLITALFVSNLHAAPPPAPSPEDLCARMKQGLEKARVGCVALSTGGGTASAVVISPEGLVITAAHVASRQKEGKVAHITYEDGQKAEVKVLGWNVETDIALYQITEPTKKSWRHVALAKASPLTGAFCFTFSHPSGQLKGRPAQVRLGRIVSHRVAREKTRLLTVDCNIQPGDSGGGLFSLDGKLIGINSSAANLIGVNLFPAIDQYYLDRKKLLNKERWGDIDLGPANAKNLQPKITPEVIKVVQSEFSRRLKLNYPPIVDFVLARKKADGTVALSPQEMINVMMREGIMLALKQPISFGLDDPALVAQLKPLPKAETKAIPILADGKKLCHGLALNKQHIITKASMLGDKEKLSISHQGKTYPVSLVTQNKKWDLAIVKLQDKLPLPAIKWSPNNPTVTAGDLLVAPDSKGRLLWGNATDTERIVSKKRSIGPVEKSLISKHRAPYPVAIRNSLPLFAADAGTPVFDQKNNFVGMHIARFSRTMALVIPAENLQQVAKKMLSAKTAVEQ